MSQFTADIAGMLELGYPGTMHAPGTGMGPGTRGPGMTVSGMGAAMGPAPHGVSPMTASADGAR